MGRVVGLAEDRMDAAQTILTAGHVWRTDSDAVKEDGLSLDLDVQE